MGTNRQAERHTRTHTHTHKERERERERERENQRERERHTERHTDTHRHTQVDRQADRQAETDSTEHVQQHGDMALEAAPQLVLLRPRAPDRPRQLRVSAEGVVLPPTAQPNQPIFIPYGRQPTNNQLVKSVSRLYSISSAIDQSPIRRGVK